MTVHWNEGLIARAISLQTLQRKCVVLVPNCNWTGHECDVLAVTTDLRIIDVEVKISRADFRPMRARTRVAPPHRRALRARPQRWQAVGVGRAVAARVAAKGLEALLRDAARSVGRRAVRLHGLATIWRAAAGAAPRVVDAGVGGVRTSRDSEQGRYQADRCASCRRRAFGESAHVGSLQVGRLAAHEGRCMSRSENNRPADVTFRPAGYGQAMTFKCPECSQNRGIFGGACARSPRAPSEVFAPWSARSARSDVQGLPRCRGRPHSRRLHRALPRMRGQSAGIHRRAHRVARTAHDHTALRATLERVFGADWKHGAELVKQWAGRIAQASASRKARTL